MKWIIDIILALSCIIYLVNNGLWGFVGFLLGVIITVYIYENYLLLIENCIKFIRGEMSILDFFREHGNK